MMSEPETLCAIMTISFLLLVLCGCLVSRAAYCNGVHDGYRAGTKPWDELHEHNGVNQILRERGEKL